jgi:hypothetical protein
VNLSIRGFKFPKAFLAFLPLAFVFPIPGHAARAAESPHPIQAFTGARTRVVWLVNPGKGDLMCQQDGITLWGIDTGDGAGPRQLLATAGHMNRPFLTPDGTRVVFTNPRDRRIFLMAFDGAEPRELCRGFGLTVWKDPASGKEWLYAQGHEIEDASKNPIRRYDMDDLSHSEVVWDRTHLTATPNSNFQLSADGTRAAALFPWPNAGLADLRDQTWLPHASGCWTRIAPDNSYRFWVFDSSHRSVTLFGPGGSAKVILSGAPGSGDREVYHPRWSNHVRYLTHTAPKQAPRVFLARLDRGFASIEGWVAVSPDGQDGAMMPDAWIEGNDPDAQPIPPLRPLPPPWRARAFGNARGGASGLEGNRILIQSMGGDIFGESDSFHFVSQGLDGDGQITARVASQSQIGPNSRIAVMMRQDAGEHPAASAANIHMAIRPGKKTLSLAWRDRSGGGSREMERNVPNLDTEPGWVRLRRDGDVFVGYHSRDGREWTEWGRCTLALGHKVDVGLALSGDALSANGTPVPSSATFDQVALSGTLPDHVGASPRQARSDPGESWIQGRRTAVGRTPTLQELAPYTAALTADVVEVEKTLAGAELRGRALLCRFAVRDGLVLDTPAHPPDTWRVVPLESRPLEKTIRLILPDDGFDLPLYLVLEP